MLYFRIFRLCALILFIELLLIRWISTEVNIFAYLQNSILVTCFLGLGMGLIAPKKGDCLRQCLPPFLVLAFLLNVPFVVDVVRFSSGGLSLFHDFLVWEPGVASGGIIGSVVLVIASLTLILVVLGSCWTVMVPLGAELTNLLSAAPRRLLAYSTDITGSLCGVLLFTLLSYFSFSPIIWFCVLGIFLLTVKEIRNPKGTALVIGIVLLSLIGHETGDAVIKEWTPYQKLEFYWGPSEWGVHVNNAGYQIIQDNRAENALPVLERAVHQYNAPSRIAAPVHNTLVVGAGTGNDVAGLLRNSDARVTAVDIDPVLLKYGRQLHPENPYSSDRVITTENDARAIFLASPPKSYDLIVFGLLDSHTTPNLSNARLDNFVYTRQSIEAARRLLTDDGVLFILFASQREYVSERIANTLEAVFGNAPLVFDVPVTESGLGGVAFVAGGSARIKENLDRDELLRSFVSAHKHRFEDGSAKTSVTNDNWPYLYIRSPSIPVVFWILGLMFVFLWVASSKRRYGGIVAPDLRHSGDTFYFLMGLAFSLVQVFSINKASILFGSTWFVNSAVISGILMMILVSNLLAAKSPFSPRIYGIALCILTVLLALWPLNNLLTLPLLPRAVAAGVISGLPMLLSGLLFAGCFKTSPNPGRALGANLFGAMVGGVLQLMTFRFGISSLMFVAAACYLVAGLRGQQEEAKVAPTALN